MKKTIFLAVLALLAASCSTDNNEQFPITEEVTEGKAPVTVHVNDFSIVMESLDAEVMTRAAEDPATYKSVGAIDLVVFDADGKNVYSKTQFKKQTSTYTTFGEFTCDLPVGHYTMVVIGRAYYDGDLFTLVSPTVASYNSERPRETFSKVQSVTVSSLSPLNLSVSLNRINALLTIQSTDARPAGISKIRTTFAKGGMTFNPTTGQANVDTGFSQTNTPNAAVGTTITVNSCPLLASADDEEEKMDLTIEVLDTNDKVLFTKVVSDVPFKRNNQTTLSGPLFTASPSSLSFTLNTDWGPGYNVSF
jgi:hypothetical protein